MQQSPSPVHAPPGWRDYALLVLLGAIWGGSFFLIKIGVESIPPLTVTAVRVAIAALFMLVLGRALGERLPRGWPLWGWIAACSVTGNSLPYFLITWGEEHIDSGLAAILMAVMPLTTYLLAHIFTDDEKLTPPKIAGLLLGIAGVVVLIGPAKLATLGHDTVRQLAVAGAAVSYGFNALVTKFMRWPDRNMLVGCVTLLSTAVMLPLALMLERPFANAPTLRSGIAVVTLGLVQTALGTWLMLVLIRRQGASFFSQINLLVPVFGVLWGLLFLAEVPSLSALAALGLILAGVAIARHRG